MTGFAKRSNAALRQFWRSEDGNTTIVCIYMSLAILLVTGGAIDVMRYESVRTKMQHVLDRAVLAAADLDQEADPSDVALDYVTTAGLGNALTGVTVDDGLNYRTVSATGQSDVDTFFMRMTGIDTLTAPALSTAEEKISKVEISLILDRSGSMSWASVSGKPTKIENLRDAAKEFVETVITPTENVYDQTTVSLVSYNATVSLGPTMSQYFNLEGTHDYSSCAIFNDNEFSNIDITGTETLKRLAHFDLSSTNEWTTEIYDPWCSDNTYGRMIVHSSDVEFLKDEIDNLGAGGNTAIDLGMKWGAALLSPAARPVVQALIADGEIGSAATQRPADYTDSEAMKVIVLMTDGENTTQYDLKSQFKTGMSDVWIDDRGNNDPDDDRFSVLVDDNYGSSNDEYYWVRYDGWSWNYRYRNSPDGDNDARRMSNAELYARFGVKAVAKKFWERPKWDGHISSSTYSDIYYGYESIVGSNSADDRLSDVCSAARNQGIVVFAIAFEAPERGQDALQDCASSPSHYFKVDGIEITETFHAIARQINNLRLIQ